MFAILLNMVNAFVCFPNREDAITNNVLIFDETIDPYATILQVSKQKFYKTDFFSTCGSIYYLGENGDTFYLLIENDVYSFIKHPIYFSNDLNVYIVSKSTLDDYPYHDINLTFDNVTESHMGFTLYL